MDATSALAQVARAAPFLVVPDLDALQLRVLTEAMWARLARRLGLVCFLGACAVGADVTGAGLGATGALATGVGAGVGDRGVVAGGVVATGVVLVGPLLAGGLLDGGVLAGGVGSELGVLEPAHRPWAQHGSTTRSLFTGMPGPSMIHRFSGE